MSKTLQTDTEGVTLALGEHQGDQFDEAGNRLTHHGWIPVEQADSALVDVTNRRIIWLHRNTMSHICWDPSASGTWKVRKAIKAYERHYGVKIEEFGKPGTGLKIVALLIREGRVTSHIWTTQKRSYSWDWETGKMVIDRNGWKYPANSR